MADVEAKITPKIAVANRKLPPQTRYGIGEVIDLGCRINNQKLMREINWRIKPVIPPPPGIKLVNNIPGFGMATFTCPSVAGSCTVELIRGPSHAPSYIFETFDFTVIEPFPNAVLVKTQDFGHTQGLASAGFQGYVLMKPNDVSFMELQFKEGVGTFLATGTGVCSQWQLWDHPPTPAFITAHSIVADGTRFNGYDTTSRGNIPPPPAGWILGDNSIVGKLERPIQWIYRVGTDPTTEKVFMNPTSRTTVYGNGTVLQQKADASRTADLLDLTDP